MKGKYKLLIAFMLCAALVLAMALSSAADMGGFSGDSDYGGGGGGGGWSSDSDSGGGTYIIGSGEMDAFDIVIVMVIFLVIVFIVFKSGKKKGPVAPGATGIDRSKLKPMPEFKTLDPDFSDEAFIEKLSNMYVQFQNHWQAKNMEPMRSNMTDALYNQILRQLQPYITNKQTNRVERIAVLGVELLGWMQDEVNDTIAARIKTRIVDYVVNDSDGSVVRGSDTRELFMEYEWLMIRKSGVLTPDSDHPTSIHCTSCGAPMDVNHSAKCEYCGTVMTNSDYDWVLSSIKGISQRSGS